MVLSSPFGNWALPEADLWSFLFNRRDRRFPNDKIIFQDGDSESRNYTYGQIRAASLEFGKALKAKFSIKKGDVIGMVSANDIDFPPVVFGALWAGACVSPANPGYTVQELVHQLGDSGAKIVITQLPMINNVLEACAQVGIPSSNIILMGPKKDPTMTYKHWSSLKALSSRFLIQPQVSPKEDLAFLVYSSGTTGKPKGVQLTHHNLTSNILQLGATETGPLNWKGSDNKVPGIEDAPANGDTILTFLPFFHIYGLTHMVLGPTYTAVKLVVMAQFRIEKWCALAQQYRCTVAYIVPPIAVLLSKHPAVEKYDLSSFRMSNSGAAPLQKELVKSVYERTGMRLKQGYGLSETSPTAFGQPWQDWQISAGSIGKLLPNMQAKLCSVPGSGDYVDFEIKEVPKGEVGELYLKGPNIFKGYHNNAAATKDCLSEDGWFRTGDVGYLDERGDLYITDRVKELIKYKGFQVPPAELEGYLMDHEMVADAAVVGVESQILGTEVPRAYIVRKGGLDYVEEGDDTAIITWFAGRVANHKKLRGGIKFVNEVPKNASGKLLRRLLKEEAKKEFKALEDAKIKAEAAVQANL